MALLVAVRTYKLAFVLGMDLGANSAFNLLVLLLILYQHDLLVSHGPLPSNEVTFL